MIKALEERSIPYVISYTKTNKVSIIVTKEALVKIRFNKSIPLKRINEYVNDHIKWIEEKYLMYYVPKRCYKNNERYLILGKEYKLDIVLAKTNKVFTEGDYLVVYTKSDDSIEIKKLLDKYTTDLAVDTFNILLLECFNKMKDKLPHYPSLKIKNYKSRWGCCYQKQNLIILNKALVHVPTYLIEYVIYHELTHLLYMDHQEGFHNFLQQYVKNERALRKELNKYRTTYE